MSDILPIKSPRFRPLHFLLQETIRKDGKLIETSAAAYLETVTVALADPSTEALESRDETWRQFLDGRVGQELEWNQTYQGKVGRYVYADPATARAARIYVEALKLIEADIRRVLDKARGVLSDMSPNRMALSEDLGLPPPPPDPTMGLPVKTIDIELDE